MEHYVNTDFESFLKPCTNYYKLDSSELRNLYLIYCETTGRSYDCQEHFSLWLSLLCEEDLHFIQSSSRESLQHFIITEFPSELL